MSKNGIFSKSILYAFSLIGLISILIACVGAYYFYKQTNFTPTEFVNKAAGKIGITEGSDELISSQKKYLTEYQDLAINTAYPRILNKEYAVSENPHQYFRNHFNLLKENKERVSLECNSTSYIKLLACYLYEGDDDPTLLTRLQTSLLDFTLDEPKESGYYGNGWSFAYIYDISRAVAPLNVGAIEAIDKRIATVLEVYLRKLDRASASLWHGRTSLAATAFLLASVLDHDKLSNRVLYSRSYGHFTHILNAAEVAGTWPEGYNYWVQNRAHLLVLGLSAMVNHPKSNDKGRAFTLLKELGDTHIYLTRPDNRIEGYADSGSRVDLKEETRKVIDIIGKVTGEERFFQYSLWLKKLHPRATYFRDYRWMIPYFLSPEVFTQTTTLALEPKEHLAHFNGFLDNAKIFGKGSSNHAIIRSGWSKQDTFISFRASNLYTHHQHYDAGHFTIFKGAPLISNSGTYGAYTSEHRLNYSLRTVAKNSILVMQANEHDSLITKAVNDGGQTVVMPTGSSVSSFNEWMDNVKDKGHFHAADLVSVDLVDAFAPSITVDISPSYNDNAGLMGNQKVNTAIRQFVYLQSEDAILLSDHVEPTKSDNVVKALFHVYNKPNTYDDERVLMGDIDNGILLSKAKKFDVQNESSTLYADIILPVNPKLNIIGGPSYQYYVDIDGDEGTLDGKNMIAGAKADPWFEQPMWRVELSEALSTERFKSLVLLQPRLGSSPKRKINHYTNEKSLSIFSVGKTLVVSADAPADLSILLTSDVERLVMLSGDRSLRYVVTSVDDCKFMNEPPYAILSDSFNVRKSARINVKISPVFDGENKCW